MITVSAAEPADAPAIAVLLEDLGRFYGAAGRAVEADQVTEALFGAPPAGYALLARDAGRLAGLAAYTFLWPSIAASRSLFLKELYVPEAYRRHGVGRLLMRAVLDTAAVRGCSRVEWTTDAGNTEAQTFYERLGFSEYPKIFYRMTVDPFA